ncbi:hypothetical protein MC885_018354 [Smutsia gigantea]|nr:hypothetical protein MC885_018354 [Smutsia gigantea]
MGGCVHDETRVGPQCALGVQGKHPLDDAIHESIPIMLVGNKADLRDTAAAEGQKCVPGYFGEKLAMTYGALFCETSAKDGSNIVEAVLHLAREVKKRTNEDDSKSVTNLTGTSSKNPGLQEKGLLGLIIGQWSLNRAVNLVSLGSLSNPQSLGFRCPGGLSTEKRELSPGGHAPEPALQNCPQTGELTPDISVATKVEEQMEHAFGTQVRGHFCNEMSLRTRLVIGVGGTAWVWPSPEKQPCTDGGAAGCTVVGLLSAREHGCARSEVALTTFLSWQPCTLSSSLVQANGFAAATPSSRRRAFPG